MQVLRVVTQCPVRLVRLIEVQPNQVIAYIGVVRRLPTVELQHVGNGYHIRLRIQRQDLRGDQGILVAGCSGSKLVEMTAVVRTGNALEDRVWIVDARFFVITEPKPLLQERPACPSPKLLRGKRLTEAVLTSQ